MWLTPKDLLASQEGRPVQGDLVPHSACRNIRWMITHSYTTTTTTSSSHLIRFDRAFHPFQEDLVGPKQQTHTHTHTHTHTQTTSNKQTPKHTRRQTDRQTDSGEAISAQLTQQGSYWHSIHAINAIHSRGSWGAIASWGARVSVISRAAFSPRVSSGSLNNKIPLNKDAVRWVWLTGGPGGPSLPGSPSFPGWPSPPGGPGSPGMP